MPTRRSAGAVKMRTHSSASRRGSAGNPPAHPAPRLRPRGALGRRAASVKRGPVPACSVRERSRTPIPEDAEQSAKASARVEGIQGASQSHLSGGRVADSVALRRSSGRVAMRRGRGVSGEKIASPRARARAAEGAAVRVSGGAGEGLELSAGFLLGLALNISLFAASGAGGRRADNSMLGARWRLRGEDSAGVSGDAWQRSSRRPRGSACRSRSC